MADLFKHNLFLFFKMGSNLEVPCTNQNPVLPIISRSIQTGFIGSPHSTVQPSYRSSFNFKNTNCVLIGYWHWLVLFMYDE